MNIPFFTQRTNRPAPSAETAENNALNIILKYHEETKHHYHRFARSLGYLDWNTQPDPFRRFEGAPLLELPLLPIQDLPSLDDVFQSAIPSLPVTIETLSRFFRNALAISAWKRHESARWALRVNPSSGNLHPTEGYALLRRSIPGVNAGLYHYAPKEHALERRGEIVVAANADFPEGLFFTGLTSIHWREAWKYGERAFRYCQHDIGHALAALRISAAILGWRLLLLEDFADSEVAELLGLNRPADFDEAEDEYPALLAAVIPAGEVDWQRLVMNTAGAWQGKANRLSASHVEWSVIAEAERAAWKERTQAGHAETGLAPGPLPNRALSAEQIIQQRRSCLSLDGVTSLPAPALFRMLARVVPSLTPVPFDAFQTSELRVPRIHLVLFIHRVDGLPSGLYVLPRHPDAVEMLRSALHSRFLWTKPDGCPGNLNLFLLEPGDFTRQAAGISCGQDIAGDGVFAAGMLAEFEKPLREIGPWFYRRLFWESGVVGQILYLEAEAAGIRSTGIGCYFDDPMHELLGLNGKQLQSLYHFTVGGPVEDTRLTTEPAYVR